jgi:hypothetical protein
MAGKSKFLDDIRKLMRMHHYSRKTEKAYIDWLGSAFLLLLGGRRLHSATLLAIMTGWGQA